MNYSTPWRNLEINMVSGRQIQKSKLVWWWKVHVFSTAGRAPGDERERLFWGIMVQICWLWWWLQGGCPNLSCCTLKKNGQFAYPLDFNKVVRNKDHTQYRPTPTELVCSVVPIAFGVWALGKGWDSSSSCSSCPSPIYCLKLTASPGPWPASHCTLSYHTSTYSAFSPLPPPLQ